MATLASGWMISKKKRELNDKAFYVKSMHLKYIMHEARTEIAKFRTIRALEDVNKIKIDLMPEVYDDLAKAPSGNYLYNFVRNLRGGLLIRPPDPTGAIV